MGAVDVGAPKGKGKKKTRRGGIRIDMTPMVDIAFLLLIFFMVTTVFRRPQALEITLPGEKNEVEVPERNVMSILVDQDGKAYWHLGLDLPTPVEVDKVNEIVYQERSQNPALAAVIKIDRAAPYHYMVDVLDEVTLGKLERFSLAPLTEDDKLALQGGGTGS